jgi:bacillithiol biosynthesis cysteine-adding enzyme BshC
MEWLDYRELPLAAGGYSELFFDYLYDYNEVRPFYPLNFRDQGSYESAMKEIGRASHDRKTLVEVMRDQNTAWDSPPASMENLALLGDRGTFAVVTGQQVGLFGGPLYAVYKAITAIKLAKDLKRKFPKNNFVPVFWLEGEDHDFAEMNHAGVFDAEGGLSTISYLPGGVMPERNVGAVGEMTFDDTITASLDSLEKTLTKSEFTTPLLTSLRTCYAPGRTFSDAFARWMNVVLSGLGLVLFSPSDPRLKKILSPLFLRELEEFPASSQLVITRSAELEHRYHAQIKAKSINLFLFHKGGRYLIEPRETDFSLKGTRAFFTKEELTVIARETPELLSPNVILRPLCQDMLLPTVAYVGGPSEIAYFAQIQPVYDRFGITMPVIVPRASASIVQAGLLRAMEKYGLELQEFFGDASRVTTKVVEQISEIKLDALFAGVTKNIHDALGEAKFGLNEIDPTLLGAMENISSKIDVTVNILKEKSIAAQKRRNETAVRQIEKSINGLLPGGSLQERGITIVSYMNKFGPDFGHWLAEQLDVGEQKHQILTP